MKESPAMLIQVQNPCLCGCGTPVNMYYMLSGGKRRRSYFAHRNKPGRTIHQGYVLLYKPNHSLRNKQGYVLEHRLVYEQKYKCCLLGWSHIHHKNGVKDDNRIENLEGMIISKHMSEHKKRPRGPRIDHSNTKCVNCGSYKTKIRKDSQRPDWYRTPSGYICRRCYSNNLKRRKY